MHNKNKILGLAAIVVVALMVTPTVAAQSFTVDVISNNAQGVRPELETGNVRLKATYQLDTALQSLGSFAQQAIPVQWTHSCPSGITVVGPSTTLISTGETPGTTEFTAEANFEVSFTRSVPGLQTLQCQTRGAPGTFTPVSGTVVNQPPEVSSPYTVSAAYYGLIQAKIATKLKEAGPQKQVPFEIEVTNFGNARTQVAFEIANAPTGARWDALVPDNLILASPAVGDGQVTSIATFTVSTPYKTGWNNEQGSYQLILRPSAADQPEAIANTVSANVLVRVRGVYVPGFEPVLMLGAVLGAAMLARRNNDEE